jgi:peptidyl-prolyl cis-trans isomerase D
MLRFLAKRNRSRNALLLFFIAILVVGLVIAFVPSLTGVLSGAASSESVVIEVVDEEVTAKDLREALMAAGQQMSRARGASRMEDPATTYAMQGPEVIDRLIREKLVLIEATRLNLTATDQEVRDRLLMIFNPWPGPDAYRRRLRDAGFSPEQFEEEQRAEVTSQKLRSFVSAAAQVSPAEVEEEYRRNKTNYDVRWVEVKVDQFIDKVQATEPEMRAYFDEHKNEYRITTEQRRAKYIYVDQTKAGETLQISDDELRGNFNPELGVDQVRVSQIVLDIPKEDPPKTPDASKTPSPTTATTSAKENETRAKAESIIKRAKGENGGAPEDFASLVRQFSQDAKTKAAGGDLGWVNKKNKRETDDPLNRVFTMKKDEVTPPIKKGNKFHILKVTDRKIPTFEESREQLQKETRVAKSYSKALEIATEAEQKLKESGNAEAAAAEINKNYGMEVATVKQTPFMTADESPDELSFEFVSALFRLLNPGEIGERQNVKNGFAVPQFLDKAEPRDSTFEEAKSKIEKAIKQKKAEETALQKARQLAQASSPDALKTLATSLGLKIEERSGTGSDSFGPLTSERDRRIIHQLKPGAVTSEPISPSSRESYVVAALKSRKDPDMGEEFKKDRKAIEDRLLNEKREGLFTAYVEELEKRFKQEGRIKVYYDVIEEVIGPPPPAPMPGGGGGMPGGFGGGGMPGGLGGAGMPTRGPR